MLHYQHVYLTIMAEQFQRLAKRQFLYIKHELSFSKFHTYYLTYYLNFYSINIKY